MWTTRTRRILPAALLAFGALVSTAACASQTYGYRGSYREVQRQAYDNGYRAGIAHGEKDARRGRDFAYSRDGDYRDADSGYRRGYGDVESYRRVFRQGYAAGYTEGYRGTHREYSIQYPRSTYPAYPTYPASPGVAAYRSPAVQAGYRDGYEAGRNDARDGERFDPIRSSRYRSADHDYDRRYGSKDDYKRDYRAGFEQGYDQGYRESRRSR